jgi:Flp pilus assembly protein TadB
LGSQNVYISKRTHVLVVVVLVVVVVVVVVVMVLVVLVVLVVVVVVVVVPATWVNTTRYCKYNQVLLMMSENIARNM